MNIENVRALARIIQQYGLSCVEIAEGDTKIRLEATPRAAAPAPVNMPDGVDAPPMLSEENALNFNHLLEVKSPMVGVFYSSPSPESPPFVAIGDKVKRGDTLCILESMKLMNEITAEQDGEIVDICMRNGEIAEFGQVLFKMF